MRPPNTLEKKEHNMPTENMTGADARQQREQQEYLEQLGPVARRCATIRKELQNLHLELTKLEEALEPVLVPHQATAILERRSDQPISPLGTELDDLADQLLATVRRVAVIVERVDL